MKMPGKCTGPKYLSEISEKWGRRHLGGVMIWSEEWTDKEKS